MNERTDKKKNRRAHREGYNLPDTKSDHLRQKKPGSQGRESDTRTPESGDRKKSRPQDIAYAYTKKTGKKYLPPYKQKTNLM